MTCVVGLVADEGIYMGADSAGVEGGALGLRNRTDAKVFKRRDVLFGFTSSFRMGQLLRYQLTMPKALPTGDLSMNWVVSNLVEAVRTCLKEGGFAEKDNNREQAGTFMVGGAGKLFTIFDDYQVATFAEPYAAIGCGESYALGALAATEGLPDIKPHERVVRALQIAEQFSAGVRRPFNVLFAPRRS